MENKLKILFLASNPLDSNRLSLDEEAREIEEKIKLSENRDHIILRSAWAVRPDDLIQILNEFKPHIVHFSGHGTGVEGIVLNKDSSKKTRLNGNTLSLLFKTINRNIKIVLLNACYSKIQADLINDSVDFVIGMKKEIGDEAAIKFAGSFYRALGFKNSIQNAFDQGLLSVEMRNNNNEGGLTPTLINKCNINPYDYYIFEKLKETNYSSNLFIDNINFETKFDKKIGRQFLETKLEEFYSTHIRIEDDNICNKVDVILLDIDDLTLINKHYNVRIGDEVLNRTLKIIETYQSREKKISGRCGDDTFYILRWDNDRMFIENFCNLLLGKINSYDWTLISPNLKVTCSIGYYIWSDTKFNESKEGIFTSYDSFDDKVEPMIDAIIKASIGMKNAKERGKNNYKKGPIYLPDSYSRDTVSYWS